MCDLASSVPASPTRHGDFRVGDSEFVLTENCVSGGSGVCEMRLVRVHGGMHPCVHLEGAPEVPGSVALWAVRGGCETRGGEIRKCNHHRRSPGPPHHFLQRVPIIHRSQRN